MGGLVSVGLKGSVGWWRDWVGGDGLYRRGVPTSQRTKDCDTALLNTFISIKTEILKFRIVLEERVIGTRGESVSES